MSTRCRCWSSPGCSMSLPGFCASPEGAGLLEAQEFLTDRGRLDDLLDLAGEFRAILEGGPVLPSFDFPEIGEVLPRLGKEGLQLEGEELAALGPLDPLRPEAEASRPAGAPRGWPVALRGRRPRPFGALPRIFRIVDHDGALKEKQIPELAAIRERIRRHREDADRSVRGLLDEHAHRGYWQTTTPTQRDGRVVLPLKAQYKGRVKGIVHEMSSSGSTLFIEPMEVVERNNAIVQEENLYRMEMRRILRELTAEVSRHAGELHRFVRLSPRWTPGWRGRATPCARLPAGRARSRSGLPHRRPPPPPGTGVVPVTVIVGSDQRVLIITGPNTGGKTVSLKTVGILSLMNQFGMEIPAAEGSALPLFDSIFADIGDEQSIEQSLSTFSAHVKNLAAIVQEAGARSLVLVDELGAGTDPQEGVALAMALLDHFMARGCIVLATTHHGILKNYGATRPGAQNASMGFDPDTLAPTYRILLGVPGESHALQIARRIGMPENVIASATSYLDDERTDISRLVSHLAERHQKLSVAEEEPRPGSTSCGRSAPHRPKELALREKELELRRHGLKDLRDFISQARKEWEALREGTGSAAGPDFGRLARASRNGSRGRGAGSQRSGTPWRRRRTSRSSPGMDVIIARTGRRGRVRAARQGKRWIVETETLRLSLLPGSCRPARPRLRRQPAAGELHPRQPMDPPAPGAAHPRHAAGGGDEARGEAARQRPPARPARVQHRPRQGGRMLRTAVHDYLRGFPAVQDFRFSAAGGRRLRKDDRHAEGLKPPRLPSAGRGDSMARWNPGSVLRQSFRSSEVIAVGLLF